MSQWDLLCHTQLWLTHTARDRDRDQERWVSILRYVLYVHTTQGQVQGTIVSYCARPGPGSMQRARAMSAILAD